MKKFLKISFLFLTSLITSFSSQAQSLITEACYDGLKVRQIPGSSRDLSDYFSKISSSDTVFAIIFPPANCPRCEALINPIFANLKRIRPNTPTVLISVYPDSTAAKKYIDKYSLTADFLIYDTESKYKNIFSFDAGYLHIPYLLKIIPSSGNLILGIRAEDNGSDFLNEFCLFDTMIEKKEFDLSKKHTGFFKPSNKELNLKHKYSLLYPDTITLSEIIYQPEFYKNLLFFNDKLRESIICFELPKQDSPSLEFKQEINTNRNQNKAFVQIPDSIYYSLEKNHDVRFIPLSPKMIDESTLAISYSLPKLWYTGTSSIGYMNQAAILMVNTDSTKHSELIPLIKDDKFFYPHFNLFKYGKELAIGCESMTWPLEFEKDEYCDIPQLNPFVDDFYSFPQPIIASFDRKSGHLINRIGKLPNLSKITKTGYYFLAPVIDSYNDEVIISDGFTGELILMNTKDSTYNKCFNAFEIPLDIIPKPEDSTFYSYDCVAPYIKFFNRNIIDVKLTKDSIYCLVRYGIHGKEDPLIDKYSVIEVNRNCGCTTEKRFNLNNNSLKYYGLRRTQNDIEPFAIYKDDSIWRINTYRF